MPDEFRISFADLVQVIKSTLAQAGLASPVVQVESDLMAEADLHGVPSHGVRMLPGLLRGMRERRVNFSPNVHAIRQQGACCLLDGDHGPGRFVSTQAMEKAIELAQLQGVGLSLATRLSHWGRAHAYACLAAGKGMIGLCATNAISNMVAWGSSKPLLGNNPLAIAVPRGAARPPLVLDMAMSQAAVGKIGTFLREGKKVPKDWGLDAAGQLSDDPAAILSGGRVLPFGGHKGAGLAFMLELLTGALAGGLFSFEIGRTDESGLDPQSSKFFLAIDIETFTDKRLFSQRVEDLVSYLHSSEPALDILLPGERGWKTRDLYLKQGIPIHQDILQQLRSAGISL